MMVYKFGVRTSDKDALKRDVIRKVLYTEAESMLEFGSAVNMQGIDQLEFGLTLPKIERLDPQEIEEGALGEFQKVDWFNVQTTMKKYQTRLMTTDEAKVRQQHEIQMQYSMTAVARGLAWAKDTEIKDSLIAASGKDISAGGKWDDPSAADIPGDIAEAIEYVLSNTYMTLADIQGAYLYYPAPIWAYMNQPANPSGITTTKYITNGMSPVEWSQQKYGVTFIPTRQLSDEALLVYKTPETAMHLVYTGSQIPTVEEAREYGVGDMYYVTQYYRTYVLPNSASDLSKNNRIIRITNIET